MLCSGGAMFWQVALQTPVERPGFLLWRRALMLLSGDCALLASPQRLRPLLSILCFGLVSPPPPSPSSSSFYHFLSLSCLCILLAHARASQHSSFLLHLKLRYLVTDARLRQGLTTMVAILALSDPDCPLLCLLCFGPPRIACCCCCLLPLKTHASRPFLTHPACCCCLIVPGLDRVQEV